MSRITVEEAKKLWIKLKPVKNILDKLSDIAVTEVRWKMTRQSKYWSKITKVDNIDFDSTKEAKRYNDLKLLEKVWEISHLKLQPKFLLQESFKYDWKTEKRISYIADFSYCDIHWNVIIEDVKGFKTDIYKIKRKLFLFKYWNIYKFIET